MAKTKAKEPEPKEVKYSRTELKRLVEDTLRGKVEYTDVKVDANTIVIEQSGNHDASGSISTLLDQPGVFGFDGEPGEGGEYTIRYVEEYGTVIRTINILSREFAEPMYEGTDSDARSNDPTTTATTSTYATDQLANTKVATGVNSKSVDATIDAVATEGADPENAVSKGPVTKTVVGNIAVKKAADKVSGGSTDNEPNSKNATSTTGG